ncbi:8870_t:CDS:2, partial [Ambispora leptoticha]
MVEPMEGVEPVGSSQQTDFKHFQPLITDLIKYADKIGESFENAELNKRICSVLFQRINTAAGEVKILRQLEDDYNALNNSSEDRLDFRKSKDTQKNKDEEAINMDMQDSEN